MSTPGLNGLIAIASLLSMQAFLCAAALGEAAPLAPAPADDNAKAPGALQTAVLAGGCFWGVEGVYEHVRGVRDVMSGYAGGEANTAHYDAVGSGRTGHAES